MAPGLLTTETTESAASLPRTDGADLFELANLFPEDTGLPMTIWVSPRGNARDSARIKVCRVPGNRMVPEETAVVAILPEPHLLEGTLPRAFLAAATAWVALNSEALMRYWNGEIGTGGLVRALQRVG